MLTSCLFTVLVHATATLQLLRLRHHSSLGPLSIVSAWAAG